MGKSESESNTRKFFGSVEFEQFQRLRLFLVNSPAQENNAVSETVEFSKR